MKSSAQFLSTNRAKLSSQDKYSKIQSKNSTFRSYIMLKSPNSPLSTLNQEAMSIRPLKSAKNQLTEVSLFRIRTFMNVQLDVSLVKTHTNVSSVYLVTLLMFSVTAFCVRNAAVFAISVHILKIWSVWYVLLDFSETISLKLVRNATIIAKPALESWPLNVPHVELDIFSIKISRSIKIKLVLHVPKIVTTAPTALYAKPASSDFLSLPMDLASSALLIAVCATQSKSQNV